MLTVERTAVITGAGTETGIGRATAHALAKDGWNIAILDIDQKAAEAAGEDVAQNGLKTIGIGCDVTDEAAVGEAVAQIEASMPAIGALVNNAGISNPTPFIEVDHETWDRVFAVNVTGSYNITRAVAPLMVEREFGRIVFLSSVSAERGGGIFGGVAYSAAKGALLGFSRALARELAPHNVTSNSVAPGLIDTGITGGALKGEKEDFLLKSTPTGTLGKTKDVADGIVYLCREESDFVTGITLDINGGFHIA